MLKRVSEGDCVRIKRDSRLRVVGEHGRSAVFLNEGKDPFRVIRVDGCLIRNKLSADWVLSGAHIGDLVIELKGRDLDHALRQLTATLQDWAEHPLRTRQSRLGALIVCESQRPAITTQRQVCERALRREFGAKLRILSGNREHKFESFFG